ncbi:hypothetical protein Acr_26g0004540 [Actinidia rufa]|uniref:NAD(P)-binding Rossmann-fold superfamily protein n=1 Tax=Actinidia rufa TaxID=165716 RepID=A0A7J0H317_9ERIC|nr:hypothetical protein Acr_26g0004540 [Actinidia rufa]
MSHRKVVLVTGCAKGGIGYEYCKALAEQDCHALTSDIPQHVNEMTNLSLENVEIARRYVRLKAWRRVQTRPNQCPDRQCWDRMHGPLAELSLDEIRKAYEINTLGTKDGAIRSNFGSNTAEKLENYDWKLYREFKEAIAERARASQGGKSTDAASFARRVVKRVLSPRPPKQIVFSHMTVLFAALSWSPLWVRDLLFVNRFIINKKVYTFLWRASPYM